uniref:Ubiquinone biosynthesis protein n=1 Tax=Trypanosoma congolense (strain IL3000) TaxID=1068625 RepID=F9W6I5_TRYCI|nr:unnamed protein product [Trypanosoma congolense IL3000]
MPAKVGMSKEFLCAVKKALVVEGTKLVPRFGFKDNALLSMSISALSECNSFEDVKVLNRIDISTLFPRGFPVAVVEHIVEESNKTVYLGLDKSFNKSSILKAVAKNSKLYESGRYKPPSAGDVVEQAINIKFGALLPYCDHWPEAAALEYMPSNAPFAAKSLVEFVDTTCYYVERVKSLQSVIASGNILLQARVSDSFCSPHRSNSIADVHDGSDEELFWKNFAYAVPLSSGPYIGDGFLGCGWYALRAKVAAVYGVGVLSFMGEKSGNRSETKAMVRRIVDRLL